MKNETRKFWLNALRILIGIALTVFLLWRLDVSKIISNISHIKLNFLIYGIISYLLFIIVSAWRWQVLIDHKKINMAFPRTLAIYFIASFFNNLLPTTIGGDVMRIYYSMDSRRAEATAVVLVDRLLGFIGLFIFAFAAIVYMLFTRQRVEFLPFIIIGLIFVLTITYAWFSEGFYKKISPIVDRLKLFRIGARLNRLHLAATDFSHAWPLILLCIIQSILIQILLAIAPFFVMLGMGIIGISILPFFLYIPIINIISMIPISFNAIGVREYAYVLLFKRANLSPEVSVTISLVAFFLYVIVSLIGAIIFIFYRKPNLAKENLE